MAASLLVAACGGDRGDDGTAMPTEGPSGTADDDDDDDSADDDDDDMTTSGPDGTTTVPGDDDDDDDDDDADSSGTGDPPELADIHYVGRYDWSDPVGPAASWPGSLVRLRIDGSELSIDLDGPGNIRYQVAVDGMPTSVFVTSGGLGTYPVVSGLTPGEHDIEVVRRNEGYFGVVRVAAVTPGPGTTIVPTPVHERRIELVGDSLTAGYGIECTSGDDNFSAETENAYLTYGMVAARMLDADPILVAHSGIGAAQNYGGATDGTMPVRYPRTHTDVADLPWDFTSWQPDVVLVNLGTNDFSAPIDMSTFVAAYAGLLGDIRTSNPDAVLFGVTWAHWGAESESWVHAAFQAAGEVDAEILQFTIDPDDGYGCDYHTNIVSNAKFGQQLADALSLELGW